VKIGPIEIKTYVTLAAIAVVMLIAASFIFISLKKSEGDAEVVNALGRQRMLTQAMAKSVLGYGMAKSEKENVKQQVSRLNRYVTSMRAVFTDKVVETAKASGIGLAMHPDHTTLPFPATFTRFVNERFDDKFSDSISIIAEAPINPEQGFKFQADAAAFAYLKEHPQDMYNTIYENKGKLYQRFYTTDRATVNACVSCHVKYQGVGIRVGDILGLRRFDILFSEDIDLGREVLNANLNEYEQDKKIFAETLMAVKNGGQYPLDLKLQQMGVLDRIDDTDAQAKIAEIENSFADFQNIVADLLAAKPGSSQYRQAFNGVMHQSNRLRKLSNDLVAIYTAIANQNNARILDATITMILIVLAMLIATAVFFKKSIINRINATLFNLQDIAKGDGDLTRRLNDTSNDELGMLARAFDEFIDKIHDLIKHVAQVTQKLADSADKTATVSNKTSAAIHRQQQETEQLATAMTEMSATVAEVARSATSTENEAQNANQSMHSGMEIVNNTVQGIQNLALEMDNATATLNTLESESDSIGSVLDVIKGIAEQTNLLALNAAIEAARAGEQGRGFAVVADEVRTLASRTQESTQEIQAMIERLQAGTKKAVKVMNESQSKVAQSVNQSNEAGAVLASISEVVTVISDMNAQIASATEEQAATAEEINRNVMNIMNEAATSSENAELADKATVELNQVSEELNALVKQFRI